ncbi:50S ribosomal protein L31 [Blochmannia endosymbiont of Camponotus (Colobopsis) obliquus]|uniref:50S ribosomal protein L31 n=1 Tax=Blochmannia endosymbiont of Camponotus (Colobopsis) obliquus TaxID=1505597 RepID=UPI00061A880D|nr:50S ribosomal protein L31 [Blochmannia endosymbiont of Camponotus (Colobopsis) obliquus]AKC60737.1 50S ribosomal protein L31 [Blochmannia endosymbiont of Camponotus (Colobopsis) obliquus]
MKKNIHPKYKEIKAFCSCGSVIEIKTTLHNNINLDVCGFCHSFYTGTQRAIDNRGRVNRFNKQFGALIK